MVLYIKYFTLTTTKNLNINYKYKILKIIIKKLYINLTVKYLI